MTGDEIKEFRAEYKLTQEVLAKILNVSVNTVARWERNITSEPGFLNLALKTVEREIVLAEISKLNNSRKDVFQVRLLTEEELVTQRMTEEISKLDDSTSIEQIVLTKKKETKA